MSFNVEFMWGCILLGAVLLFCALPLAMMAVICQGRIRPGDGKQGGSRICWRPIAAAGVSGFLFYLLLHRILFHRWNVIRTAKNIVKFRFTYQDAGRFALFLSVAIVGAVLLGLGLRQLFFVLGREVRSDRLSKGKEKSFLFLSAAAVSLCAMGCWGVSFMGMEYIVINEACGNNGIFFREDGESAPDYIELYNKGVLSCELDDLYLSDSETVLKKKEVPSGEISAGGHMVVWLDNGFSLRKDGGETIFLSDESGKILDSVTVEATDMGFSYARQTDGEPVWAVLSGTPGAANELAARWVECPVLSHDSGFYQEAFELELSAEPGAVIYYTLDGSVPTAESLLYQGPIRVYDRSGEQNVYRMIPNVTTDWLQNEMPAEPVDKGFVVRAVAVIGEGENARSSSPVSATYYIGLEEYRQSPVISLVTDPGKLFNDFGIYVTGWEYDRWYLGDQENVMPEPNYLKRGREWEIDADFSYFSDELIFSQKVGLRVRGGFARYVPLKQFSLYARKEYGGSNVFDENIFDDVVSHKLMIRGGFANAICHGLAEDRFVAVQQYVPVSVFLDGEFWYRGNLMEAYDGRYFEQRYGVGRDNLILLKNGEMEEGEEEDLILVRQFYDFLDTHDMTDASDYEAFGKMADLQSYIDYMCINIYADNLDFDDEKNVVMWRSKTTESNPYEDGRWRWALYDLDALEWGDAGNWGLEAQQEKDSFSMQGASVECAANQQTIYRALRQNPDFCRQFVLTFMDLVNANFRYENVREEMDAYGYNPEGYLGGNESQTQPEIYYDDFFRERASYIVPYLAEEFALSGTLESVVLTVNDPRAGKVTLNTISPDLSAGTWSGQYYTDYPVTVKAEAADGYQFSRWEVTNLSSGHKYAYYGEDKAEISVEPGGVRLTGIFEKTE